MECSRMCVLSEGEAITGIKDDGVKTKTFPEGTHTVGSLGFVRFASYVCAETPRQTLMY